MKKILSILLLSSVYSLSSVAQSAEKAKPEASKEQKAEMKKQKEAQMMEAFAKVGLSEQQITRAKVVIENTNAQNKAVKADAALSEDQKKAKLDENKDLQKKALADLMGPEKYKQYAAIKKEQKAANAAAGDKAE